MVGVRKKGILSGGNNKFSDKRGWIDVIVRGDNNLFGNVGLVSIF